MSRHRPAYSVTSSARACSIGRNVEAKRLGSLEIDRQLELGGLHDRRIRRAFAPSRMRPV
ncbi:MAG TPA: hypothetical protein VFB63_16850 [Bryobacteraceae bacterium]|nr:hypothetical protein [Bryobacteraceae bacterium]